MVRLFVRHAVADYGEWRKEYDAFDSQRRSMGVTGDAVYQSVEDPNDVTVTHDFDEVESAKAVMSSEELRAAMHNAGVQGQPQIWITSPS
jgi:hypothetical protein